MRSVLALAFAALLGAVACGGGSSSSTSTSGTTTSGSTTANTVTLSVNGGADPTSIYANGAFASVTVCVPGTTTCQTIDKVLVDTGSSGLRVLSDVLTLPLSTVTSSTSGTKLENCVQYADTSFNWGPVAMADVKMAGEVASNIPIQIIANPANTSYPTAPTGCSNNGFNEGTVADLGANGILGVGNWRQDCGSACSQTSGNPGMYYACSGTSCNVVAIPLTQQVQNPVWMFSTDNNGVVIQFPALSATAATATGTMTFGIGTQSNNALGSAKVLGLDGYGTFSTTYSGASYPYSFIDSGSNGFFFLDSSTTGITQCPSPDDGWYCPTSSKGLTATNVGTNGVSSSVNFTVDNAENLFHSFPSSAAFPTLAGNNPGAFDWGLPFFYGRTVATAIEGQTTSAGTGPFVAY